MEEILRQRISELEKEIEKLKKKLAKATGNELIFVAIKIQNAQCAINNLYICIGRAATANR